MRAGCPPPVIHQSYLKEIINFNRITSLLKGMASTSLKKHKYFGLYA
jgi:hypothetical protein